MVDFCHVDRKKVEELRRTACYRFIIYNEGLPCKRDCRAKEFLQCGRDVIMSSVEMAEQRLLLAKVEDGTRSILLYVDRDCFELTHRQYDKHTSVAHWQWAEECEGMSMEDLEAVMAGYLRHARDRPAANGSFHTRFRSRPAALENQGDDPPAVRALEAEYDHLV